MKTRRIAAAVLAASMVFGLSACGQTTGRDGEVVTTTAAAETTTTQNMANAEFEEADVVEIDENQETGTIKVLIYYDLINQDADLVDLFDTRYNGSIEQEICSSGPAYFEKLGTLVASDLSPDIVRYE